MSTPLRQSNFLGGELNPLLYGRTDLGIYPKALRTCRNWFPSKHGSVLTRPGSLFLGNTKNIHDESARLIPFVFSDDVSYALEFGPSYIRFWNKDGQLHGNNHDPNFEITTAYQAAHLRGIKYAQTGAVLTLTRNGYAASQLRLFDDWTYAQLLAISTNAYNAGITAGDPLAADVAVQRAAFIAAYATVWAAAVAGSPGAQAIAAANALGAGALIPPGAPFATFGTAYADEYLGVITAGDGLVGSPHWEFKPLLFNTVIPYYDPASAAGSYPVYDSASPAFTIDGAHPAQECILLGTQMVQETLTGRIFETLPRRITSKWDANAAHPPVALANNKLGLYSDQTLKILRGNHTQLGTDAANTANTTFRVIEDRYYRGRGDPTGKGIGLFGFVGSTNTGEFVDDGAAPNYALQPPRGTNPFLTYDSAGALSSVESPFAVAFFQNRLALAGTYLRPFTAFLSAVDQWSNFDRHTIQIHGEALLFDLAARRFEEVVHLVNHEKLILMTKSSNWSLGGLEGTAVDYDNIDVRMIDEVGATDATPLIVDGAVLFARTKGAGVRALRSDSGANYRGVDVSQQSDHLFLGNGQLFSTFGATRALIDWTYAEDPFGLVWAVREDGLLLSLTYKNGEAAWARHDGQTRGAIPARYQSVCAIPETTEDSVYVIVKRALGVAAFVAGDAVFGSHATVPVSPGWSTCVERMTSRVHRGAPDDDCAVDCAVKYSGPLVGTFTGLEHLNGEDVYVVAVGNPPKGPLRVVAGQVTVADALIANDGAGLVAYIGIGFVADLEPLDIAHTDARMRQKTVKAVGIETTESRGLYAGFTFADKDLVPVQKRSVAASYGAQGPETRLYRPNIPGTYDETGRFVIRQKLPLCSTITAITREVDMGDPR